MNTNMKSSIGNLAGPDAALSDIEKSKTRSFRFLGLLSLNRTGLGH